MAFIDEAVEQFAYDHTRPESDVLVQLRDETFSKRSDAEMQVGRIEGQFLKMLVRLTGATTVLEIGMFTGYS
ncbi:MAG TPA: methyltransferase, partial [Blastocatellia bacterium]|nr:methyltransferase [Blastocatellia bacterium]